MPRASAAQIEALELGDSRRASLLEPLLYMLVNSLLDGTLNMVGMLARRSELWILE